MSTTAPPVRVRQWGLSVLVGAVAVALVLRALFPEATEEPLLATWATIFVSISVQALPFLALGVTVSGAIAAIVPPGWVAARLPRRPLFAIPGAGLAGAVLPGCECGSVPIAGRLAAQGVPMAAALTFMLAAPAINPIVLIATAVAFPDRPDLVVARFAASLLAAVTVGFIWTRWGARWMGDAQIDCPVEHDHGPRTARWAVFASTAGHDFLHAGGWLVVGAVTASTLQVLIPRAVLDAVAGNEVLAIAAMATLAVILAVCSEADAFVVAGLSQFSLTSRLVFLVVGPMVDVKLVALQIGVFGRRFAMRFAPLTLAVAVASAVLVGAVVL